jgi:RNA polymerase sigma factor (sigma-70 family)
MSDEPLVFVVDDDDAVREGLQWLFESVGLAVRAYASAQQFLADYDGCRRGCLVLDVRMPGMSGLELQALLAARGDALPVIILTGHADVPMAVRAMRAGAFDFIEKPFNDQLLLERIHQAIELDRRNHTARAEQEALRARLALLSAREQEVLELLLAGRSNREMAEELQISSKTVEVHRARVMEKMQAPSLAELVQFVLAARGPGAQTPPPAARTEAVGPATL